MKLTKSTFDALKHHTFNIHFAEDQVLSSQLIEIKSNNDNTARADDGEAFSLIFQVNNPHVIEQNTYLLNTEGLPDTPLFLVPVDGDDNSVRYEAIFN